MRLSFLALGVIPFLMMSSAYAEEPAAAQLPSEQITVVGRTFTVTPFQMEQPSLPWKQVKSCLPETLKQAPAQPMSDEDILGVLESLQADAETSYEALLIPAINDYTARNPRMSDEQIEFNVVADALKPSDKPGKLYQAACESLALTYLHDMLYAKMTPPPAPGTMPSPE
jgi:hypothetical protein